MHRIPPLPFCDPVFCILILCENARTAPELHVTDSLMIKLKNKKLPCFKLKRQNIAIKPNRNIET